MNVFRKRNLAEINDIQNYKVDSIIKLVPFKDLLGRDLYNMYQDIPENEIGSTNILKCLAYEEFKGKAICIIKIKARRCSR